MALLVLLLDEDPSGVSGSGISGSSLSPPELAGLSLGSSGFAGVGLSSGKISGLGCDGVCGSGIVGESGTVGVSGTLGGVTTLGGGTKTLVERPTSAKRSIRKRSFIFFFENLWWLDTTSCWPQDFFIKFRLGQVRRSG